MDESTPDSDNINKEILSAKITATTSVSIEAIDSGVSLEQPHYAINWFNTNRLWLYNLYNLLALPSVKKVGGKAIFKGYTREVMVGDASLRRDILLIVRYPGARQFLRLLEGTWFKLVSVFRLLSVAKFTFGFTHRTDEQSGADGSGKHKTYALHHFRSDKLLTGKLEKIVRKYNGDVFFSGQISSVLFTDNNTQKKEQVPCMMTEVVVVSAENRKQIGHILNNADYRAIIKQTTSSFIATLDRVL